MYVIHRVVDPYPGTEIGEIRFDVEKRNLMIPECGLGEVHALLKTKGVREIV